MSLFNQMQEAFFRVRRELRKPVRWRINYAAVLELRKDECSGLRCIPVHEIERRRLFGAPICIIDDRNREPTFFLSVELDQ